MKWREATLEDLAAHISQEEIDAYRQSCDFQSQADPVQDLIVSVSQMVRGYCRKNFFVNMGPDSTIPNSLISPAMDIVVYKMLKRMPMEVLKSREYAYQQAMETLEQVAKDEMRPESHLEDGALDPDDYRNVPFYVFPMRDETLNPSMLRY